MTSALPWTCFLFAWLGGSLGSASPPHAEVRLSIKPLFSAPVYITKDPQPSKDPEEKEQAVESSRITECEILNTIESGLDFNRVKTLSSKSFSFFVKPEPSFKKLVFMLSLQNVLYSSDDFYSDEKITLTNMDLRPSEGSLVKVEHYQYKKRGFDRHSFRVSYNNTTLYAITHDSWLFNAFKGFAIFAEGGTTIFFNCVPKDFDRPPKTGYVPSSVWVLAGLMSVAAALLVTLCLVWVYLKHHRSKKRPQVSPLKRHPIYDEFDEEVLDRIKQKIEALRSGNSVASLDTVVVGSPQRQENLYVLEETGHAGVEQNGHEEHIYEDIEKYYKQVKTTDYI